MPKIKELKCEKCGGIMHRSRKTRGEIGLFIIIIGFLLLFIIPFLGVIVIIAGCVVGSRTNYFWVCKDCGYKFERQMNRFSFRG
jgi:predicted nucleic acid-binding Zn ribbon protein